MVVLSKNVALSGLRKVNPKVREDDKEERMSICFSFLARTLDVVIVN
jgi:hypothetical protein